MFVRLHFPPLSSLVKEIHGNVHSVVCFLNALSWPSLIRAAENQGRTQEKKFWDPHHLPLGGGGDAPGLDFSIGGAQCTLDCCCATFSAFPYSLPHSFAPTVFALALIPTRPMLSPPSPSL